MRRRVLESNPGHRGGTGASAYPLRHPCSPLTLFRLVFSAKVQLENKKGHTALDVAKAYADPRVIAIVQKRWDEIPPPVDKKKRKYNSHRGHSSVLLCKILVVILITGIVGTEVAFPVDPQQ